MTQNTVSLPATHGDVRSALNNNAGDAETRLAKPDKCRIGFANFQDAATSSSPITVPSGITTWTLLTNDTLGALTDTSYLPEGLSSNLLTANQFDFSDLSLGDMVDFRVDLSVTTTSVNQRVAVRLRLGIGSGSEYSIPFMDQIYKSAGTYNLNKFNGIYIGNAITKDYPAQLEIASDASADAVVSGWYVKCLLRGEA